MRQESSVLNIYMKATMIRTKSIKQMENKYFHFNILTVKHNFCFSELVQNRKHKVGRMVKDNPGSNNYIAVSKLSIYLWYDCLDFLSIY